MKKKLKDIKGVIRSRKSKKDGQSIAKIKMTKGQSAI